jgi:hypothetical protein
VLPDISKVAADHAKEINEKLKKFEVNLKLSEDKKDCFFFTRDRKYFRKFIDTIGIPEK